LLVGTDIQPVSEVADAISRFGDRYLVRLFTEHEIASCGGRQQSAAAGLTARFAAKEATIKVLRPTDLIPRWRSIEVRKQSGGWVEIALYDEAAALASQRGISDMTVSLSHAGDMGTATVVATADSGSHDWSYADQVPGPHESSGTPN
jgi:holo-[acyl-carrier protein] synthase